MRTNLGLMRTPEQKRVVFAGVVILTEPMNSIVSLPHVWLQKIAPGA